MDAVQHSEYLIFIGYQVLAMKSSKLTSPRCPAQARGATGIWTLDLGQVLSSQASDVQVLENNLKASTLEMMFVRGPSHSNVHCLGLKSSPLRSERFDFDLRHANRNSDLYLFDRCEKKA